MQVTVFGIGYVGLVQAAVLAEVGHNVINVDINKERVEQLRRGEIPIYEPGLKPLVLSNHEAGRLDFTTDAKAAIRRSDILFIAVGTPPDEDGSADLSYVLKVAETIATHMDGHKVVINKSTVPVGTADKVKAQILKTQAEQGTDYEFDVVSNPEFLKEGAAVADCMKPDRIVIGTDCERARSLMRELYAPFNRIQERIMMMDVRSAELTKYAANCMLATKISFMNEMSNLAELLGADIEQVRQGIGSDKRIGYQFIYPGCGYGGSCFPKDVQALIRTAHGVDYKPALIEAVEGVNVRQKEKLFKQVERHFKGELTGKTFAVWGLAFKPNTDDMREAPSRPLMEALWAAGARVQAYDPEAMEEAQRIYGDCDALHLMGTKEAALKGADALIICTEWKSFWAPDLKLMRQSLNEPVIFDGRNLFDPHLLRERGFDYYGIGRGKSVNA